MNYHTAYRGIVYDQGGNFDHFVRQVDLSHLQGGYWRFHSFDDDRLAFSRGFTTPEDLLVAADSSDEKFDEITLRWVRGARDSGMNEALSGTASQHLQTIYEVRHLLGLPVSLRGQIPLYPVAHDDRLKQYWEEKHTVPFSVPNVLASKSTAPSTTHSPDALSRQRSRENPVARAQTEQKIHEAESASDHSNTQISHQSKITQSPAKQLLTVSAPSNQVVTTGNSSTALQECPHLETATRVTSEPTQAQTEVETFYSSPIYFSSGLQSNVVDGDGIGPLQFVHRQPPITSNAISYSLGTAHTAPCICAPKAPTSTNVSHVLKVDTLSTAKFPQKTNSPPRSYTDELDRLPCMDCGNDDGHKRECHIGNIGMKTDLTVLDYRILADAAQRLDPGPWTTHFDSFPDVQPGDFGAHISGIAEVIRNEDSYREDAELHTLPDDLMIALWAFKTSGNVHAIDE